MRFCFPRTECQGSQGDAARSISVDRPESEMREKPRQLGGVRNDKTDGLRRLLWHSASFEERLESCERQAVPLPESEKIKILKMLLVELAQSQKLKPVVSEKETHEAGHRGPHTGFRPKLRMTSTGKRGCAASSAMYLVASNARQAGERLASWWRSCIATSSTSATIFSTSRRVSWSTITASSPWKI